jgi:hypothetical protein
MLLGSCFEPSWIRRGRLAAKVAEASAQQRIDIKLLCGDQVYLDPVQDHFRNPSAARAYELYRRTWTHVDFAAVLAQGANYFCPDDHDLWDNYTTGQVKTPADQARDRVARALFDAFQGGKGLQTFYIHPLRVALVDARLSRTELDPPSPECMTKADLQALTTFVKDGGEGPCVIVIGQPLFGERGYKPEKSFGTDIPQYTEQFDALSRAILESPSSVLILTGDLHFGRIAHGTKKNGKRLIEVISSPLSLSFIRYLVGIARPWRKAHESFPSGACHAREIETECYRIRSPHFVTLDFEQGSKGNTARLECRSWSTRLASRKGGRVIFSGEI